MSKQSRSGFGIIECLISILLLTFIMVGGMSFYIYSNSHLKFVTYERIAADLANSKMEEIKQGGYNNNPSLPTTVGTCLNNTAQIRYLPATISACWEADLPPDSGCTKRYKQVAVNVTWIQPGQTTASSIGLHSFIAE